MMGYLYLGASLLCGVIKGFCGKKTSGKIKRYTDSVFVNLIRMLLCIFIGLALIVAGGNYHIMKPHRAILLLSAVSGISTSAFVIFWMLSVRKSAYMLVDVSIVLGTLVPLLGCRFLYNEQISLMQWFGLGILLVSLLLMCSYNVQLKRKLTISSILLLLLCGLSNGITDLSQKMFMRQLPNTPISVFNFYTYIFSAAILFILYTVLSRQTQNKQIEKTKVSSYFGYLLVMAACLFGHSYFRTAAAGLMSAAQLYPVSQGCALILSAAMSAVCFKEKPTTKSIIALILTFIALLFMNM